MGPVNVLTPQRKLNPLWGTEKGLDTPPQTVRSDDQIASSVSMLYLRSLYFYSLPSSAVNFCLDFPTQRRCVSLSLFSRIVDVHMHMHTHSHTHTELCAPIGSVAHSRGSMG